MRGNVHAMTHRILLALLLLAAPAGASHRPVLLAVFAHPDDEILVSGTLVEAVRLGLDVRTVYVTSGDAGQDRSGRGLAGPALRAVRERELTTALARLGLPAPRLLGFPDGGVWENRRAIEDALTAHFDRERPDAILAFGPDGVTGHADHVASGVVALAAADRTGRGRELWTFHVSTARAGALKDHLKQFDLRPVDARRIDLALDVRNAVAVRTAAMTVHRTQFPPDVRALLAAWFRAQPLDELVRVRGDGRILSKTFESLRR